MSPTWGLMSQTVYFVDITFVSKVTMAVQKQSSKNKLILIIILVR